MAADIAPTKPYSKLNVRISQPVQGCELRPYALLVQVKSIEPVSSPSVSVLPFFCSTFLVFISGLSVRVVKIDLISTVKEASAIFSKRPTPICGFDLNNPEFAAIGNVLEMWGTCM